MDLLNNIKVLRKEYGISQQKLGDEIGVSQQSINKYENHDIEPDISTLIKIADYFETSVDYIVGHTDIRRKIEKVSEYALNEPEKALVDKFRLLSASSRKIINDMIDEIIRK